MNATEQMAAVANIHANELPPGLLTQGVPGVPQDPFAPRRGPLGSSPDRESAIGNTSALVAVPLAARGDLPLLTELSPQAAAERVVGRRGLVGGHGPPLRLVAGQRPWVLQLLARRLDPQPHALPARHEACRGRRPRGGPPDDAVVRGRARALPHSSHAAAVYHRSSTLHQTYEQIMYLYF
jgi:hypothetical protein